MGGVHEAGARASKRGRGLRPLSQPVMRQVGGGGAWLEVTRLMGPGAGDLDRLALCGERVVMTWAWTRAITCLCRGLVLGVGEGRG